MSDAWTAPAHLVMQMFVGCGFSFYSSHSILCLDQWKELELIKLAVAVNKSIFFKLPKSSSRENNKNSLAIHVSRMFMPWRCTKMVE